MAAMRGRDPAPTPEEEGYERFAPRRLGHAVAEGIAPVPDPKLIARAEQALEELSGEFTGWIEEESDSLARCFAALAAATRPDGKLRTAFYRCAHDLRGAAATFGFPLVGTVAESLCQIMEANAEMGGEPRLPLDVIGHHVAAVRAMIREDIRNTDDKTAGELVRHLRRLGRNHLAANGSDGFPVASAPPVHAARK